MDRVEEINIYWAGSASDAEGLAVTYHTIHIFTGEVASFNRGQRIKVKAGSGREKTRFPEPLGLVNTYHLGHPEPITLPAHFPGIHTVTLKGGLKENYLNRLAILFARLGLTNSPAKIQFIGKVMHGILPFLEKIHKAKAPMSGIRVDVKGFTNGKKTHLTYQCVDRMRNLTGIPLAIGALMLGKKEIQKFGVVAPEAVIVPEQFIQELARRDVLVSELKIEE